MPISPSVSGTSIPEAQAHLDLVPERLIAIAGNTLGTLAVIASRALTFRRHPLGNSLIVAGTAVAAVGSAVAGLGAAPTALFIALAAVLLYAGFLAASGVRLPVVGADGAARALPLERPAVAPPATCPTRRRSRLGRGTCATPGLRSV